jgi:hypothetical protein
MREQPYHAVCAVGFSEHAGEDVAVQSKGTIVGAIDLNKCLKRG